MPPLRSGNSGKTFLSIQRARCSVCNEAMESLEHILLDCHRGQANSIWILAKSLWPTAFGAWPEIHLGTILGCGSVSPPAPQNDNHPNPGKSRLLQILLSESAHLIWVLRCKRVIQDTLHTNEAVKTRWYNKINHRLSLDRYIALKWNRKPVTQEIVKRTWYPSLLQTTPDLTEDWITNSEVLVGIKPPQPPAHRGLLAVHGAPISKPTFFGYRVPRIPCHVWTCTDTTDGGYTTQNSHAIPGSVQATQMKVILCRT